MKTLRAWVSVYLALALFILPVAVNAQGLVPCGAWEGPVPTAGTDAYKDYLEVTAGCNLCDVGRVMQSVIDFAIVGLAIPLAAAMFAYAGVLYFTAGSNSHRISRATSIFKNVGIGFLIVISGWLIINTIMTVTFSKSFFNGREWFEIQCIEKISSNPGSGDRLIGTSFSDLLDEVIPDAKAPPPPAGTVVAYDSAGNPLVCPPDYAFNPQLNMCFRAAGGAAGTPGESGDGGGSTGGGVAPVPADPGVPVTPGPFVPVETDNNFTFNPGISQQMAHASPALQSMLNCISGKVAGNVGRISSISDSLLVSGAKTWAQCKAGQCQHTTNSYHYGGSKCGNQSYAVDFGDEENYLSLLQAAQQCNPAARVINEGDHVHIQIGTCN